MINKSDVTAVLTVAMKTGADFAELFVEDSISNSVQMNDGQVESASYSRLHGAGVRVLMGTRSAYAYTADTSLRSLLETANAAAAALKGNPNKKDIVFSMKSCKTVMQIPFASIGNDKRIALLQNATKAARDESNEISKVMASYMDKVQRVLIANSDGLYAMDERPRTRSFIQSIAILNGEAQVGYEAPGCCRGFEAYTEAINMEEAARTATRTAVAMLHGRECPACKLPVVIDGGFGGVIFHESCGHSLEATSVSKGNSEFAGKLGQKIAADCVSAVDDGTMPGEWGTINMDDEGYPGRRNQLIKDGVLVGYMIDKLGGRRMNMPVTGSSRRQDYSFAPTSRMTNTFIDVGNDDDDEMISSMAEGLYAKKMGGGSVNPMTGEFNFSVQEGYWVRNGQIYCPVRGVSLIGKGGEILKKIDRVGKNMWMGQGMCGSLSGSVPTNVGQPRIRVSEITIGGKGGKIE